jgi:hypothetical protein
MKLSPIVFFVYNRPRHTILTLEKLLENNLAKYSDLIIFSDAAKNRSEKDKVILVRKIIHNISGFRSKKIFYRKQNFGLAKNFINGISLVCKKYQKVIVLEDDNVTSPYFLQYMNDALNIYKKDNRVASISGYSYPIINKSKKYYFLRLADSWGWATWKRSWNLYEKSGYKILKNLKKNNLVSEFNFENTFNFFKMLENFCLKKNNSWSIRWYGSMFLKKKLTLFPPESYVDNIGMDRSGIHSIKTNDYKSKIIKKYIKIKKIPVEESKYHFNQMKIFFMKINQKNNFINKIKKIINIIIK